MGAHFMFTCSACGYSAEVSGGRDYGFVSITRTITCTVCKELVDVKVGEVDARGDGATPQRSERKFHKCPNDPGHKVRAWSMRLGCPRCSAKMTSGPATVLWD